MSLSSVMRFIQPDLVPCTLVEFDHLISKAKLGDEEKFQDFINPVTKVEVPCRLSCGSFKPEWMYILCLEHRSVRPLPAHRAGWWGHSAGAKGLLPLRPAVRRQGQACSAVFYSRWQGQAFCDCRCSRHRHGDRGQEEAEIDLWESCSVSYQEIAIAAVSQIDLSISGIHGLA